jgi:hypothetical protein
MLANINTRVIATANYDGGQNSNFVGNDDSTSAERDKDLAHDDVAKFSSG